MGVAQIVMIMQQCLLFLFFLACSVCGQQSEGSCISGCCFEPESYIVSGGPAVTNDGGPEYYDSVEACAKRCADLPDCRAFDYHKPGSYYGRRCYLWTAGKIHPQRSTGLPAYAGVCPAPMLCTYQEWVFPC